MTEKPSVSPEPKAEGDRIVIRDKRKINPSGGTKPASAASTRKPPATAKPAAPEPEKAPETADAAPAAESPESAEVVAEAVEQTEAPAPTPQSAEVGELRKVLEERTADLQRVTAEYANYRKRVDRDRTVAAEQAIALVLAALLPVLDDVDRAREHGDLTGPFASVAEQLNTVAGKFGLTAFGAKGDTFDPNLHEAVAHLPSAEVTEPTCVDVMRRGYLLGERLLRPAMVAVAGPESE